MGSEKHTEKGKQEIDEASKAAADKSSAAAKPKDAKDDKIAELTNLLQHLQADFENYKKRAEKEHQNQVILGKALLIRRILPVLDTFDHALKEHKGDADGLKRVYDQLIAALEAEGFRPIKAEGEKLDPYRHECIGEESSEQCKGMVVEEIQKGYMLNDMMIRHSLVKVSSGKALEAKEPKKSEPVKSKEGEK